MSVEGNTAKSVLAMLLLRMLFFLENYWFSNSPCMSIGRLNLSCQITDIRFGYTALNRIRSNPV
jgi:hypothetical protein